MNKLHMELNDVPGRGTIDQLRRKGYSNNYILTSERLLRCIEDNTCIGYDLATVKLVDHTVGDLVKPDILLFIIETNIGGKGIMTISLNARKKKRSVQPPINLIDAFWEAL